ncbi:hypothetical protein ACFT5C_17710 [Streptomyces sp. NPDC057116]|uniref:hypothetical protein n=1 Tax=Streptomyces sp. NPDC057116 TaxID=3346023 RepID=UPI00363E9E19
MAAWQSILEEARETVGFTGHVVPRNLDGIRHALLPERLVDLDRELATLTEGSAFEVFLDHWWTQALADSAVGREDKERAIEFADLAIALRVKQSGATGYTQDEVEAMLGDLAS